MASRMDEFRVFLTKYPGIVEDVKNGNHSWQQMYENWVVLGENDASWQKYQTAPVLKETEQKAKSNTIEELLSSTSLKNEKGSNEPFSLFKLPTCCTDDN